MGRFFFVSLFCRLSLSQMASLIAGYEPPGKKKTEVREGGQLTNSRVEEENTGHLGMEGT